MHYNNCRTIFRLTLVFVILLISVSLSYSQQQHPIIQRIIKKDSGLYIFKQKVTNPDKFTVVAAVDKQNHKSYFISRYGDVVDSIPIADGDYSLIESGQMTAFEHFNALREMQMELVRIAKEQILRTGNLDTKWQYHDWGNYLLLKSDTDSTKKISSLNDYRDYITLKKWLVNNPNPSSMADNYSEQPEVANTFTVFKNNGSAPLDSSILAKAVFMENLNRPAYSNLIFSLGIGYNHYEMVRKKVYELTDHRGNVMAEIADGRTQHSSDGKTVDYYEAEVVGARDYYAFGSTMTGRTFGNPGRYGFNGKEDDSESGWQDYGMRMYSGKLGRFFSVDPIAGNYPELSTFQFASNSPLSGTDLDWLEYIHYNVLLNRKGEFIKRTIAEDFRDMSSSQIKKVHGIYSDVFYKTFSQSFGPEGRGVKYTYYKENDIGTFSRLGKPQWNVHQNSFGSQLTRHGIFYGAGSITKGGPKFGEGFGKYDIAHKAIDMTDAIAKEHDIEENTINYTSWTDPVNIFADIRFVKRLKLFISEVDKGNLIIDPFTTRHISNEAYKAANMAIELFSTEINRKKLEKNDAFRRGDVSAKDYGEWKTKVKKTTNEKVSLPSR